MAILQQRIYELETYTQVSSGIEGYENPNQLFLAVDKVGWAKPKRMVLADMFFASHIEAGRATATALAFTHDWDTEFDTSTYLLMIEAVKVEVMDIDGNPVNVETSIPYHSLVLTTSGFSLTLAEYTGVIIKYFAVE